MKDTDNTDNTNIVCADKFTAFTEIFMEKTGATLDDIFEIEIKDNEMFLNVPESFVQLFWKTFPDKDINETLNNFIKNVVNDILKKD
jgi:hypothetical protein